MDLLLASVAETAVPDNSNGTSAKNDGKRKSSTGPNKPPKTPKQKAARQAPATFACERCRRLHEKCDGYSPCSRCSARDKACEYRDGIVRPPPPKIAKLNDDSFSSVSSPLAPSPGAPSVTSPRSSDVQSPVGGPASVASSSNGVSNSRNILDPNQGPVSTDTFNSFVSAMTHLTAERTRALIFIDSCLRTDNPQHTKWLKYQAAFLGEPSGFFSNLHTPPYESLQFAFEPVGSLTSADQLCDAAEHLTILCNGAMIYCDISVATEFSKKACEFMDRLVSEYPNRAMNDLFYRMCCTKAIIAVCYFLSGEILSGVALLDSVATYTQLWEPNPISGQLLLQVHAVRWSQLGDNRDFEFCRVICKTISGVAKPWIGFLLAHGIRRVHSESQSVVQASKALLADVGDYPSFVAKVNRLLWEGDVRLLEVLLRAPRSILCMDAGLTDEAREHATRALSLIESLKPPGSFSIAASTALIMKVFMHLGLTALANTCREILQTWTPYYPITTIWLQLIPNLYTFTQNAGFQQLFMQDEEGTEWSKAAAAAGLAYDQDIGLFLGPLEPSNQ